MQYNEFPVNHEPDTVAKISLGRLNFCMRPYVCVSETGQCIQVTRII